MSKKRTPQQLWKALEDEARDDEEIERLEKLSPEALDAELAAAGFDPEKERAEGAKLRRQLEQSVAARRAKQMEVEARAKSMRPAAKRRPAIFWIAAAAIATIAAGGLVYALTQPPSPAPPEPTAPPLPPHEPPESRDLVAAADLRRDAAVACSSGRYDECLRLLDEAKEKDPLGDRAKVVREMREKARSVFVDGAPK